MLKFGPKMRPTVNPLSSNPSGSGRWFQLRRTVVVAAVISIFLASCGQSIDELATNGTDPDDVTTTVDNGSSDEPSKTSSTADAAVEEPGSAATELGEFPDVTVTEVAAGTSVNLRQQLSGGDSPILLWFYAPH